MSDATSHALALFNDIRRFYAMQMQAAAKGDERVAAAFLAVPRESFLPPGPWRLYGWGGYVTTPSSDSAHLYQNLLVALDEGRGINNGEPTLHASWMGRIKVREGETVCQLGAGHGYYSAVLATLAGPTGRVHAFEIVPHLAEAARGYLRPYPNVEVVSGDATSRPLPPCDVVYVCAGVAVPPTAWFEALRVGGRLIFPWRPADGGGLTVLVTRRAQGFSVERLAPSYFIPCIGTENADAVRHLPTREEAMRIRSAWLDTERQPDASAVAALPVVWFSADEADAA